MLFICVINSVQVLSKKNPKVVEGKKYLDALKKRCESMNHLSSLKLLLDIWDSIETL
jgi:hypothetical protein